MDVRLRLVSHSKGCRGSAASSHDASLGRAPEARSFEIDVLTCPWCGEKRKLIALITDGIVVRKFLGHLGLPTEPTNLAPARVSAERAFDP